MRYTPQELQVIKDVFPLFGSDGCAKLIDRSQDSIRHKASQLNIKGPTAGSLKNLKSRRNYENYLKQTEYTNLKPYISSQIKIPHKHDNCGFEWLVRPCDIKAGYGCPKCSFRGFSNIAIAWINSFNNPNILHAKNKGEQKIAGYSVDGYDPLTNTVYEFHGDCWHGNPEIFDWGEQCHPYNDKTAFDLYFQTINKSLDILKVANLVEVWENEYKRGLNGNFVKKRPD